MANTDLQFHLIDPGSLSCRCPIAELIFDAWACGWNETFHELGLKREASGEVFSSLDWVGALCRDDGSVAGLAAFNTYALHRSWGAGHRFFSPLPVDLVPKLRGLGLENVGTCEYFYIAPEHRRKSGRHLAALLARLGTYVLSTLEIDGTVVVTRDDRSVDALAEAVGCRKLVSGVPMNNTHVSVLVRESSMPHREGHATAAVEAIWAQREIHGDAIPERLANPRGRVTPARSSHMRGQPIATQVTLGA